MEAIAVQNQQYIDDADTLDQKDTRLLGPLITIPVVVHIVFNTPDQKLSNAVIQSQIDELNLAFRGASKPGPAADMTINPLPAPFASRVGDARVQFCLATRAPDGSSTNGITIQDNTVNQYQNTVFYGNNVMHTATGGTDAWDTAHYLNIWCCAPSGNNGISSLPGQAIDPREDGVTILYIAFGLGPHTATNLHYHMGRIAVHEIGHWLNLTHIWGPSKTRSGCFDSDYVVDTPNQNGGNVDNPSYPHYSCSNEKYGNMFMNHMDYTDDDSNLMFTKYQALWMQASFAPTTLNRRGGYRESLRSSPGLCPWLSITNQSGTLPTNVTTRDQTDYGFQASPTLPGCGGGTISYEWTATGGWTVTHPDQPYPHIIPSGNSASVITLTGTYTNAQGFSFPLNTVHYVVSYNGTGVILPVDPTQSSPTFTSAAAALCAGSSYAAAVAPVAGASGYLWTVPAGFISPGLPIPSTGQLITPWPNLPVIPTTTLAGGIYLLQCQALGPNGTASAAASVPLTVNGGPQYEIVDMDPYQRTAQHIVCRRNYINLRLVPMGPTVPGAVPVPPRGLTWSSNQPNPPGANLFYGNASTPPLETRYSTPDGPDQSFEIIATYLAPCGGPDITTAPYTATTAPAITTSLNYPDGTIYPCATYTYPRPPAPPVLPPSAPYPNPSTGRLHLPGYRGAVVVYNQQGQPVQRLTAPGTATGTTLDTSAWPEGLYVVTGLNLRGEWQRHTVQIQH